VKLSAAQKELLINMYRHEDGCGRGGQATVQFEDECPDNGPNFIPSDRFPMCDWMITKINKISS